MGFPIDGQLEPTVYLAGILRYKASKVSGSRLSPLGSRDVIGHVITAQAQIVAYLVQEGGWVVS